MGSGKSFAFCYEALFLAHLNAGLLGLIGAPTYKLLRDATKRTFLEILEIEEIPHAHHKSENKITLSENGSEIIFRSLENPELLRGSNLSWFGVDELTYCKPEAWSRLEGRLRHDKAVRLCGFAAWTPKGFDQVYDRFVDQPTQDYWAVLASPRENHYVSQTGLYDRLERNYDERLYKQEVLGEYLNIASGQVYYAFDRRLHVKPQLYNPLIPLCWALDFNVNPMCSVLCQIEDRTTMAEAHLGYRTVRLNVLDEIVLPDSNTPKAVQVFLERAPRIVRGQANVNLRVYGDPAGGARSTTGESDWQLVRTALARSGFNVSYHVPRAHPLVKDRVNAVNAMLRNSMGEVRMGIDPACRELIRDLEQVVWATDAAKNPIGDIDKKRDPMRTHVSDALGYLIAEEFGLKTPIGYRSERII